MSFLTRAKALASLYAVTFAGGVTVCAPVAGFAAPKAEAADPKALGETLALELAAISAYTAIVASKLLSPPVLGVLNGFLADHTAHRDAILKAIAATGAPATEAPAQAAEVPAFGTEGDILAYVYGLERTLASAHLTALGSVRERDDASTTGSILGVETTHVALLAEALRKGPAYPAGFVTA